MQKEKLPDLFHSGTKQVCFLFSLSNSCLSSKLSLPLSLNKDSNANFRRILIACGGEKTLAYDLSEHI